MYFMYAYSTNFDSVAQLTVRKLLQIFKIIPKLFLTQQQQQ
jgi:hypothetical protein